jgi:hypothetical protein
MYFLTQNQHAALTLGPIQVGIIANYFQAFAFPCRPVHGLIFLFKWKADDEPQGSIVQDSRLDKIFFAKQVKG